MRKTFTAKKPYIYNYEITVTNYKDDTYKIDVINHQWDSSDYAFVKKDNLTIDGLYSYSTNAVEFVKHACIVADVLNQLKDVK